MADAATDEKADPLFGPGSTFGGYLITRCIGAGGMAKVYEAVHVGLKKRVALKALGAEFAQQPEARTRFLREGEAASRIRHPNVVDITDVGVLKGTAYLVMEYLEGESLEDLLKRQPVLAERRIADIMIPVAAAVAAAHAVDVVHRDLKPDNIYLTRTPHGTQPKVLDFGISKVVTAQAAGLGITGHTGFLGTPYYMSPEQARDFSKVDSRGDQYSIGVILYECATGQLPFNETSLIDLLHAITTGEFPKPREHSPSLSTEFEDIICRAMALRPEDRFASCTELGAALLPFASRKTRMVWETVFGVDRGPDSVPPPTSPDEMRASERPPEDRVSEPDPVVIPASPPVPRMSPVIAAPSRAEVTVVTERPQRGGLGRILLAASGVAVAVAVVVALLFYPGNRRAEDEDTAPEPAAGAPTSAGVEEAESEEEAPPEPYRVRVRATPPTAEILLDGVSVGIGSLDRELPADGRPHEVTVRAEGHLPQVLRFVDTAPPGDIALVAVAAPVAPLTPGRRGTTGRTSTGEPGPAAMGATTMASSMTATEGAVPDNPFGPNAPEPPPEMRAAPPPTGSASPNNAPILE